MSEIDDAKALVLELFGTGSRMESILTAALSRARADALEEAANALEADARAARERHERVGPSYIEADAKRIRALITTPAPATIPVERVREVLDYNPGAARAPAFMSGDEASAFEDGWGAAIRYAEDRLGVDLDAKGEGKDMHTEHCCKRHGCKYRDAACPVESGATAQPFPCEQCVDEGIGA